MSLGLIILISYWLLYPYNPIVFNNLPYKVDSKMVRAGGLLSYNVDYCKYNNLIPQFTKSFVNGIIYIVPPEGAVVKPSGCHVVKIVITIPETLPPDTYILKISYRYQVNPIRTVDVMAQSEPFKVIK